MAGPDNSERILRAKYLDWCSARVADSFLALTPDEIYQLAENATHGQAATADPLASLSSFFSNTDHETWRNTMDPETATRDAEPFRALVAKVTEVLAERMALPTFEEWSAAYQESPEDFDDDLLGFWKEES
ncbi:MAG TPA: hypothetical protein VGD27_11030 [Longimicrobiales bacterium]